MCAMQCWLAGGRCCVWCRCSLAMPHAPSTHSSHPQHPITSPSSILPVSHASGLHYCNKILLDLLLSGLRLGV
ncbi:hypothetical protein SCLCIDRAFT_212522 [Scleroderma citrinum Foug A]|uniref:C2H2-type domain-containing protein n=1 Tax=Scleroderma citrinum Foug A TaxID=1036808 RepID=A0A0C3D7L4_9AGAM|nr:hypothetical protein SCLCIDRAFT_212522 [Scleroderma citrinum Foug A]